MTLDAYDWAWRHARSRGNARLVVLALADKTTGPDATARLGLTEAMRRLGGVGKGTAVKALADAVASGDIEIATPAAGSRAALYRIPGAVDYVRRSGPDHGPQTAPQQWSGIQTGSDLRSGSQTTTPPATGLESGPVAEPAQDGLWSEIQTASGPESGPHHSPNERVSEGVREEARPGVAVIPQSVRPIVDQITAAGVIVAWTLSTAEWFIVEALAKRSGPDMLAAAAVQAARRNRRGVSHARYFLRTWQALPPAPAEGTTAPHGPGADVIPLDPTAPRKGRAAQSADHLAAALAAMEAQQ